MKKLLFSIIAITLFLGSCTVEKRHYMSGYHVEWNNKNKKADKAEAAPVQLAEVQHSVTEQIVALEQTASVQTEQNVVAQTEVATASVEQVAKPSTKPSIKQVAQMKAQQQVLKQAIKENAIASKRNMSSEASSEPDTVLLIVLAFLIPPLAVYLYEGSWTSRCTVNLILTLLCGIPGLIHALVVILGGN